MYTFNKFAFCLLMAALVFVASSCGCEDDDDNEPITTLYTNGYVYDADTEKMIEGATVEIIFLKNMNIADSEDAMITYTSDKGFFEAQVSHLYEAAKGGYLYKVSHPDYQNYEGTYSTGSKDSMFCGNGYECKDGKNKDEMTKWLKDIKIPLVSKKKLTTGN